MEHIEKLQVQLVLQVLNMIIGTRGQTMKSLQDHHVLIITMKTMHWVTTTQVELALPLALAQDVEQQEV